MALVVSAPGMDLDKTIKCGQLFRYQELEPKRFLIHAKDRVCEVQQIGETLFIESEPSKRDDLWLGYFDVNVEPAELETIMSTNSVLRAAYEFSKGIRFIRWDPFECLISFIISQQKRIPQIQASIERLCDLCGPRLQDGSRGFPEPQHITRSIIPQLKLGYRGPYVYNAASEVASGDLDLEDYRASRCSYETAMQRLQRISGVGVKIADCVALFSLGFTNAFPIDTHIKQVLLLLEMQRFRIEDCGEYAGLVQQYLYNYALYNGY